MLEIRISIDGEIVTWNALFLSYVPVRKKSYSTLLSLDAHTKCPTGSPIFIAYQPARISPKFPVGTVKFSSSPNLISPISAARRYAQK